MLNLFEIIKSNLSNDNYFKVSELKITSLGFVNASCYIYDARKPYSF